MRSHNPRHYLLYLNIILFLILLAEIGFDFSIFPKVAITKIELDSDLVLSDTDVYELLGFYRPRNYYSVDPVKLEQHARSFALVHEIQISKKFPDRLKVRLKSRKPVLVMLQRSPLVKGEAGQEDAKTFDSHGKAYWQSIPILVDAEAVMFEIGLGNYDDVPILSGLSFSPGSPLNSRLPSRLSLLVRALGSLKEQRPELYSMISEVRTKMDIVNLETDIYLENTPSYIKTSGKIDAETIETALIALEVLRRSNESTPYLDMRTTGIVYRPRENGSGSQILPVVPKI